MRVFVWLLRAFIFFSLFAFALNNQQLATVHWFFGTQWQAPLVMIVLVAFAGGCAIGAIAMVPTWWRHRRAARRNALVPAKQRAFPGSTPQSQPAAQAAPREGL
jgi:uncharacterized integral membrane protein